MHAQAPPPPLRAYWFYTSPLPLDDPLSPLPAIPAAAATTKHPPRPFSRYDSTALEAAYQQLLAKQRAKEAEDRAAQSRPSSSGSLFRGRSLCSRRASTDTEPTVRELAREGHPNGEDSLEIGNALLPAAGSSPPFPTETGRESSPLRKLFSTSTPTYTNNKSTTQNPFIRSLSLSRASTTPHLPPSRSPSASRRSDKPSPSPAPIPQMEIPVGIQRLHKVLLPSFVMTPIYWSPLHDVASVMRGTWFYKDRMLPVEAEIANRLETGWEEVRAWTEEWDLELASAVEVGREGEEKVRWPLWDKTSFAPSSRPGTGNNAELKETLPVTPPKAAVVGAESPPRTKPNEWDWVLFANAKDAFICRDTMLSFGNKRPLANIRKGKKVGIHVVRGFCEGEWERLHPGVRNPTVAAGRKRSASAVDGTAEAREKEKRSFSAGGYRPVDDGKTQEEGLGPEAEERVKVTDLFLIIHGIGQKLSERMESFHFTHAVNSFRRHVNVELRDEAVRPYLRDGGNVGMMVLPINWRSTLSFEDGLHANDLHHQDPKSAFTLSDITPPSIPAVRNLISDVMLDIPYYLSQHKPKMVRAVVKEANRVYRLWCQNNPGFEKEGRVHIIAHSLGSVIAMDILSKQPAKLDVVGKKGWGIGRRGASAGAGRGDGGGGVEEEWFEFDTKNVFFVGSPAGFFLLLNRNTLLPRKGRNKPGAEDDDKGEGVAGEAGTLGCMAIDNIYNVLHYSDPIAYRLNPTVDPLYAASLKPAMVPSTATSWAASISSTLRSVLPSAPSSIPSAPSYSTVSSPPSISRLPSNIELETHNFSREELAERRLYLLNDNGQVDWWLGAGRGGLENQYLTMLGAHSSYWESRDFVRLVVVECGRVQGRGGSVPGMRAQKRGFGG